MRRSWLFLGVLAVGCIEPAPPAGKNEPRRPFASPAVPSAAPVAPVASASSPAISPAASSRPVSASSAAVPGLPAGAMSMNAVFGGVVEIAGYKVEPPTAAPGQQVSVTLWIKVLAQPTADDMIFVHVDDSDGRPERVNGDHWPASHKTPMPQWKVGETVMDQFSFTLGGFGESSAATIWLGFWSPERDERLPIVNAAQLKTDGHDRLALADIPLVH